MTERALFELDTFINSLDLNDGDLSYPQVGGIYGKMSSVPGFERHHIPSSAAQEINKNHLPAILITKDDHKMTDSFRGKQRSRYDSFLPDVPKSPTYKDEVKNEISEGNYIEVVKAEIFNIIDTCGHKYDGAIKQYFEALREYIKSNGVPN